MKKYFYVWLFLLAFLPVMTAQAREREINTYLYRDYIDCVFLVNWENKAREASVELVAPDGRVIAADASNTEFGEGSACVSVGTAESGYWTVRVNGDGLGTISVSGGSRDSRAAQYNAIQSFNVEVSGGNITFSWKVLSEQDAVNLAVNAWQGEGAGSGSRTVWNNYSAEKSGSVSIGTENLVTGLYRFSLQAYDGTGQYTLFTEEALYVVQPDAPDKVEEIKAGSIDGDLYITWDAGANNGYLVTLYDYDTLSLLKSETVWTNFYSFSLEDGVDRVKFSVAAIGDSAYGEFEVFPLILSTPAGTVAFPESTVTREASAAVRIDCPENSSAGVYLDGKLLLEAAGTGNYDLNLAEGEHEVVAYIEDENGNRKTFSKALTVDMTPPAVSLSNPDSVTVTEPSLLLTGYTEPNAVVAVNGVEQELGTGWFTVKLALDEGINPITVTAYDLAGNKSVKTITAEYAGVSGGIWTMFLAPGVLAAALTIWYIILNRKAKGVKNNEKAN